MKGYELSTGAQTLKDRIRTVLFDLDGTLLFHKPDSFDMISSFCTDIGQPLDAETERLGRRTRHEYFVDPIIVGRLASFTLDQFWCHFNRHLLQAIGIQGDLDLLAREATDRIAAIDLSYHCPEAGCRTLAELRARGYKLGLITNRTNTERFYQLLDQMDMRSYFDLTLASGEVGIRKPEPGIFHTAMERLGTRADRSVYVGDNYWADVIGAERAGVIPILYDPLHLFPEANCLILERMDQLLSWLP
jgi:putative hydrolase of the HAD superfamily